MNKRIEELEAKIKALETLEKATKDEKQKYVVKAEIERISNIRDILKRKLSLRQENYFNDSRAAFF